MKRRGVAAILIVFILLSLFLIGRIVTEPGKAPVNAFIKRSSSAIALTADGDMLLVVNPDSNSLTLVDTATRSVIAELPVGIDPRTVSVDDVGDRAYVANRRSNSVSAVDLASRQVIAEVPVGHRPYGLLVSPDGSQLYVAEQGDHRINVLDAPSLQSINQIDVTDRPSGLAISDDGRRLYLTHLLSNQITILTVQPYTSHLPIILQSAIGGRLSTLPDRQPIVFSSQRSIPLWLDSNLVQSIVIDPNGQTAYVPHTRSNTSNRALSLRTTVFPLVSLIDLDSQQHLTGQQFNLDALDPPAVGLPFDAAITPDGTQLWVLNAASNDITVIDLTTRQRAAHIEVGDNPRGIVLSPDGATAYVNNTLAGTVSVVDTAVFTVTSTITTTQIPLPPLLLQGKRLFHSSDDPRMGQEQWIACNTCHFEGEHDGRTWFLSFAGPRNTTSLMGMIQTYPLRWSGEWNESADSEFVIRKENFGTGLISGNMNCSLSPADCINHPPNQGRAYDLDALAAYLDFLPVPLSPAHANGQPLSQAEQRGQLLFTDPALECLTCHPPPLYTDHLAHDVGTTTADERIGPDYDTPSLRGLYNSAPYFHDGSAPDLFQTLTRPTLNNEHDVSSLLTGSQLDDLIAFLLALPYHE
jgi:YVTN family beta-propeller protein